MAKIFISYRREDSQHAVDRLQEAMRPYLKNPQRDLFIDVDNIPIGVDFEEHLQDKVSQCDAVLAVIGPNWLIARSADGGRRLDKSDDFVRTEIESALKRNIPVVPVLLDGTPMPRADQLPASLQALAKRNGAQLDRKSFRADVEHIMSGLGFRETKSAWPKVLGGLVLAAAVIGIGVFGLQQFEQPIVGDAKPAITQDPEFAFAGAPAPGEEDLAFSNPRNALIARYQIALTEIAYYDGPIDGQPSDIFHDATKLFSSNYGLTNLGLDFANLDAIERQVLFAEDLLASSGSAADLGSETTEENTVELSAKTTDLYNEVLALESKYMELEAAHRAGVQNSTAAEQQLRSMQAEGANPSEINQQEDRLTIARASQALDEAALLRLEQRLTDARAAYTEQYNADVERSSN